MNFITFFLQRLFYKYSQTFLRFLKWFNALRNNASSSHFKYIRSLSLFQYFWIPFLDFLLSCFYGITWFFFYIFFWNGNRLLFLYLLIGLNSVRRARAGLFFILFFRSNFLERGHIMFRLNAYWARIWIYFVFIWLLRVWSLFAFFISKTKKNIWLLFFCNLRLWL